MTIENDTKFSDKSVQYQRINLQRWRTALNIVLLFIVFRDGTIVRNDGHSGFGEFAFKGAVICLSLIFLFINFIVKKIVSYRGKTKLRISTGDVITTLWLAFFAAISIIDACSDDKGYCRHWSLFSS